jgi:hypothetical protein
MKTLIIFSLIMITSLAFAAPSAEVVKLKGKVLFNGEQITKSTVLKENGVLEIQAKSYLKVKVKEYGNIMMFAPNTKVKLNFKKSKKQKKSPYTLVSGMARWITKTKKSKIRGAINTKTAVFGVRGTDFLIVANPLLAESEIVCFDGKVQFINKKNKKDNKRIGKNQWGGLGGRFGSSIGKVLTLPAPVINHFKSVITE